MISQSLKTIGLFPIKLARGSACTLLKVGGVYLEHTTPRAQLEMTRSSGRLNFCKRS